MSIIKMKQIILAIDSFKGSLTSDEAEAAVKEGLQSSLPECNIISLPVSDGGEGVLSVLLHLSKGHYREMEVTGPCGNKIKAQYGISGVDDTTAFIELASAAGLPLVPPEQRNPMNTTTYGVGELILAAVKEGKTTIIIGIGGSATNDAGTGLLSALGYRFMDKEGRLLPGEGKSLSLIDSVDTSHVSPLLKDVKFKVACDVNNPFYGSSGAAYVFAPQKGADQKIVETLDRGLKSFCTVIQKETGTNVSSLIGAGAAGGVGGALAAFLHARLQPGIDLILDALHFDELLQQTDMVITGEGHADKQSIMGKVVSGILKRCKVQQKPVLLLCGGFEDAEELNAAGITSLFSLVPSPVSLETAMQKKYASKHLQQLAIQLGHLLQLERPHK